MLQAFLAALALIGSAVIIHYESLRAITILTSQLTIPHRGLGLVVIAGVLLAHLVKICGGIFSDARTPWTWLCGGRV